MRFATFAHDNMTLSYDMWLFSRLYDIPLLFEKEYRYEGDVWAVGINYGYHLALAKRWGLEFTAGVGMAWLNYVKSECPKCGDEIGETGKTYYGPTELGVKVVFMIK